MMKGRLTKLQNVWKIRYFDNIKVEQDPHYSGTLIPLYPDDVNGNIPSDIIKEGKEVEFEIVDEFTHQELFRNIPWGEGIECAKIKI